MRHGVELGRTCWARRRERDRHDDRGEQSRWVVQAAGRHYARCRRRTGGLRITAAAIPDPRLRPCALAVHGARAAARDSGDPLRGAPEEVLARDQQAERQQRQGQDRQQPAWRQPVHLFPSTNMGGLRLRGHCRNSENASGIPAASFSRRHHLVSRRSTTRNHLDARDHRRGYGTASRRCGHGRAPRHRSELFLLLAV